MASDAEGCAGLAPSAVSVEPVAHKSRDQSVALGKDLLSRQDYAGAEGMLRRGCAAYPDCAPLWGLLGTACWSLGRHDEALAAVQKAFELTATEEFTVQKGWMLSQLGELRAAEAILQDAAARFPQSFCAYQNLTQVYKRLACWAEGAAAAERACTLDPGDFDMRESWASCLLFAERERDALTVIEEGLRRFRNPASSFTLLMRKARGHEELGETDEAIDALVRALELRPDDSLALRQLCSLALTNGRRDRAHPYRQRLYDIDEQRLPDRLADGLAAIWERTNEIGLDAEALEWAWELADKSQWTRPKWETAVAWGRGAAVLLTRWRESAPAREFRQLDELVEAPDLAELSAAAVETSACFVTAAHIGPTAPVINFLARGNRGYRVIGRAERECREQGFLIPITSNSTETARAIAAEIRKGVTIGLAADDPVSRFYISLDFLGRHVELPAFVPKMIRKHAGASFWCFPMWRDGKIVVEFERLPDPLEQESHVEWCGRWFRAYLAKLERAMRSRPENLILFGGIWGNVSQIVLRARIKMTDRQAMPAFAPDVIATLRS